MFHELVPSDILKTCNAAPGAKGPMTTVRLEGSPAHARALAHVRP